MLHTEEALRQYSAMSKTTVSPRAAAQSAGTDLAGVIRTLFDFGDAGHF
jgi:hypothetical protein